MSNMMFEDAGGLLVSFRTDRDVRAGQVVKVIGNGTVAPCQAGDLFCGVVGRSRGDRVGVQVNGFAEVAVTLPLKLGRTELVADGNGGVMAGEKGVAALVVDVDTVAGTAMICL